MKNYVLAGILIGIGISIVLGTIYLVVLNKVSGFGIGACIGIAFTTTYIKNKSKNKK